MECARYLDGTGSVSFPCGVDKDHEGPCAAAELPRTIEARQRWLKECKADEERQRHQESGLAAFQGMPQTSATGLHADPTAVAPHPDQEVPCPFCLEHPMFKNYQAHLMSHKTGAVPPVSHRSDPEPEPVVDPQGHFIGTRAGREGDSQAMPTPNDNPFIHDLVCNDLQDRLALGIKRYGVGLQSMNGRNATLDLYEELLDAVCYLKQHLVEQEFLKTL